jgi:hypothetical protein
LESTKYMSKFAPRTYSTGLSTTGPPIGGRVLREVILPRAHCYHSFTFSGVNLPLRCVGRALFDHRRVLPRRRLGA